MAQRPHTGGHLLLLLHQIRLLGLSKLDMLGVTLKAAHSATMKANEDELVERVQKVVGPWRAGYQPHGAITCAASWT